MRWLPRLLLLLLIPIACTTLRNPPPQALKVLAPKYLRGVIDTVGNQFMLETGAEVKFTFVDADSVFQMARILAGYDLLLSNYPVRARQFATDSLILDHAYWCPLQLELSLYGRADGPPLASVSDLSKDDVLRVVIINPELSYEGKVVREVLIKNRRWDKVQDKLILARSPAQLRSYLETGEADAAVAFDISAMAAKGAVQCDSLDNDVGPFLALCGMVLAKSKRPDTAAAFLDFLESSQCILYRMGGFKRLQEGRHIYRQ